MKAAWRRPKAHARSDIIALMPRTQFQRALLLAPLAVVGLLASGCPRNEPALPIIAEGDAPAELLSSVNVADPRSTVQLLEGFHGLEQRSWRWTERRFAVVLQPPAPVASHRTALELRFTVPGVVIDTLGPLTLTASIDGVTIGVETYREASEGLLFSKDVPDGLLGEEPVQVRFELDKAVPPNDRDGRELGVIVSAIALQ